MNNILDLTTFKKAIISLKKALDAYEVDNHNEFIRDSCIQRFEYCYDFSIKMIRRHLKNIVDNAGEIDQMSFESVIREAYTKNVIKDSFDIWADYRADRNETSHGYDETLAKNIVNNLNDFYTQLTFLIQKLEETYEA